MTYFIVLLFATSSFNPLLDLADTKNSKGYTIDSYVSEHKSMVEDKKNKWILEEFIRDEFYFKELFRKVQKMNEQEVSIEQEILNEEEGKKHLLELSEKRPYFYKYMTYIFAYTRS